jgi:hypothetical protein
MSNVIRNMSPKPSVRKYEHGFGPWNRAHFDEDTRTRLDQGLPEIGSLARIQTVGCATETIPANARMRLRAVPRGEVSLQHF